MSRASIVEYFGKHENYSCGYCKSSDTSVSHGLYSHYLTPQDYQDMIDRGWRRSGKYCYKPLMDETCCPQYTIRCNALDFKLSKSQKKVLKKVNKFLAVGKSKNIDSDCNSSTASDDIGDQPMDYCIPEIKKSNFAVADIEKFLNCEEKEMDSNPCNSENDSGKAEDPMCSSSKANQKHESPKMQKSKGIDPNRPQCRKAKDIRRERRMQKLLNAGHTMEEIAQTTKPNQKNQEKSLEDFLNESVSNPVHRLELRLVPSDLKHQDFSNTFKESYLVYLKYQSAIHKNGEECTEKQYIRFLVNSPFKRGTTAPSWQGSFHQQYWLDGKMIAVGVLDILPYCVSSVYFFYDPDYSFLSLGTYASLREIAFTRELHQRYPALKYYYMGFYIHSCPKMRYKGSYYPSNLLCPETYAFHPIEECLPKLEISKYQRFEENPEKSDEDGVVKLDEVMTMYRCVDGIMNYVSYRQVSRSDDEEDVREYANLVGKKCYRRMLLYRK